MLPVTPMLDSANLRDAESVVMGDHSERLSSISTNSLHIGYRDFAAAMALLGVAIRHVVLHCAKEQMLRIYAWSNVAVMAHLHAFWNWTTCQFPREAMSKYSFAIARDARIATDVVSDGTDKTAVFVKFAVVNEMFGKRDIALSHGTSNKGEWPVASVGLAGCIHLFPVSAL